MSRMSARFVGQKFGNKETPWVYDIWNAMGLVIKDKFGDWVLTEFGRKNSGKMSKGDYPVPTFDFEIIEKLMRDFCNKHRK